MRRPAQRRSTGRADEPGSDYDSLTGTVSIEPRGRPETREGFKSEAWEDSGEACEVMYDSEPGGWPGGQWSVRSYVSGCLGTVRSYCLQDFQF